VDLAALAHNDLYVGLACTGAPELKCYQIISLLRLTGAYIPSKPNFHILVSASTSFASHLLIESGLHGK
jgi:hypothetical protein